MLRYTRQLHAEIVAGLKGHRTYLDLAPNVDRMPPNHKQILVQAELDALKPKEISLYAKQFAKMIRSGRLHRFYNMVMPVAEVTQRVTGDGLSVRCIVAFVMFPTDGTAPGLKARFDVVGATR